MIPDTDTDRPDLLHYLAEYRRAPARQVRRAERWRRRGATTRAIAGAGEEIAKELAARGMTAGGRVGLYLNDGPLWLAGFFGALRAGAVAVPLDPTLPPDLLHRSAAELELEAWISEREVPDLGLEAPRVELDWTALARARISEAVSATPYPPWPEPDPDRIAEIVLTSGTSGLPKAVAIRHRNLMAVLDPLATEIEAFGTALRLLPPLRLAVSLPLSHLYGQVMGVFLPVHLRAHTITIPTLPGPELARILRLERASVLATVPRTLALLGRTLHSAGEKRWGEEGFRQRLAAAADRPWYQRWLMFAPLRRVVGLRLVAVVTGGAAIDPEIEDLWRRLGYAVVQGYGLTEAAPLVTLNHPFHTAPGSLGKPLPGVEVRLASDGEILVRGANVTPAPPGDARVDREGWLHTGDLGRKDPEGRLYYLARKGDRIVTPAGVNIDPEPLAQALRRQPGILDAVVVERPWGARGHLCAVVTALPGADVAAAVAEVNRNFPDAARIRAWELWPGADFPRTHTGKPRRREILDWLERQAPAGSSAKEGEEAQGTQARQPLPADPYAALARMVSKLAGTEPKQLAPGTPLADVLTSLDRVELATLLESAYGLTLSDEAFTGSRTLEELARDLGAPRVAAGRVEGQMVVATRVAEPEAQDEATDDREAAVTAETRALAAPASAIPQSPWRTSMSVKLVRFVLREAVMRPLLAVFVRIEVSGRAHLETLEPPFILAANHLSFMDPAVVLASLPFTWRGRLAPAARWSFFVERKLGPLEHWLAVLGFNAIPLVQVGDWRPTLEIAGALADRGYCPLIFPEGERSRDGELGDFQLGVALMAQNLHLPILPCAIAGLHAVLPPGARWPRRPAPIGRAPVAVRFGPPLPAPRPDQDLRDTAAELRSRIAALHAEALRSAGRH